MLLDIRPNLDLCPALLMKTAIIQDWAIRHRIIDAPMYIPGDARVFMFTLCPGSLPDATPTFKSDVWLPCDHSVEGMLHFNAHVRAALAPGGRALATGPLSALRLITCRRTVRPFER